MYKVCITNSAEKDMETCQRAGYGKQLAQIIATLENNPYDPSQHFERLTGNLKGYCSRQINYHNRVLYEVLPNAKNVKDNLGKSYDGIVLVYEAWKHRYKKPK